MQLRTVCDKRLYVPITSGNSEAKISIDIQQTLNLFCNNVSIIDDKIFATDFLRFFRVISKNVKSHVFLKSEKNEKYVFSNTVRGGSRILECSTPFKPRLNSVRERQTVNKHE